MESRDLDHDELNLEQAEYDEEPTGPPSCTVCETELFGTYYEINGLPTCESCRHQVEEESRAGSPSGRFFRALTVGAAAGVVGALIWYAVQELTGYQVGLVAIVVGWLVGKGVRWGCNARGGWVYQGMAMSLTYLAIVLTFVPQIFTEIRDMDLSEFEEEMAISEPVSEGDVEAQADAETTADEAVTGEGPEPFETVPETSAPAEDMDPFEELEALGSEAEELPEMNPVVGLILGTLVLVVLAAIAPFLSGSIMGLIIIAIGLYEAWRQNKKLVLEIEGPFQLGSRPPGGAAVDEAPPAISP